MKRACLFILLLCSRAYATDWFLDGSASGSHNGASWANAWTVITQITGVNPGDTIYISGGASGGSQTYTVPANWIINTSTSATRVNVKIGQDSAHNGTAIFSRGSGTFVTGQADQNQNISISGDAGDGKRHFKLTGGLVAAMDANGATITNMYIGYVEAGVVSRFGDFNSANGIEVDNCSALLTDPNSDHVSYGNFVPTGFDQNKCHNCIFVFPNDGTGFGSDGLQWNTGGYSIYSNIFVAYRTNNYTGNQHEDMIQDTGGSRWIKIYDNVFLDSAQYAIFMDAYQGGFRDVYIYNNVMCYSDATTEADSAIQVMGFGVDGGYIGPTPCVFSNCVVVNNLSADYTTHTTWALGNGTGFSATFAACVVANNVDVNNTGGLNNPGFTGTVVDNVNRTIAQSGAVWQSFTSFAGTNNNFHLKATAAALIGIGTNLSTYFTLDFDSVIRPAVAAWDVGPFQFAAGGGTVSYNLNIGSGTLRIGSGTVRIGK